MEIERNKIRRMMLFIEKLFGKKVKKTDAKEVVNYYYQTIIDSSLQGLSFAMNDGKLDKNRLQPVNICYIDHNEKDKATYEENLKLLTSHISKMDEKKREKYKIVFFPFCCNFLKYSSTKRKVHYITTPLYFLFDVEEGIIDSLKEITLDTSSKIEIFEDTPLVYNRLFASFPIGFITVDEIERLSKELEDEELEKKYPTKDIEFLRSIFYTYMKNSKLNCEVSENSTYNELIEEFYNALAKIEGNDKIQSCKKSSAIILIENEKAVEADKMLKGLMNAYKSSIVPFMQDTSDKNKFNRIFFKHEKKVFISSAKQNKSSFKNSLDLDIPTVIELQKKHLGSFSQKFALTLSQRLALCSTLSSMDVIPVNGPPGTGKTALLRAIFANYIVDKAFCAYENYHEHKMNPFVLVDTGKPILGTSSVGQAINNLISGISDGFKEASEVSEFTSRWLDLSQEKYNDTDLNDNFIFVPQIRNNEEKFKKDVNILLTSVESIFLYKNRLDGSMLEKEYLSKYNKTFEGSLESINACIEPLYQKISKIKETIEKKVSTCKNMHIKDIFRIFEKLDKEERFELFFMSMHLLEAFLILNIKSLNKQQKSITTNKCYCPVCDGDISLGKNVKCQKCHYELAIDNALTSLKEQITQEDIQLLLQDKLVIENTHYGTRYNKKKRKYFISVIKKHSLEELNVITPLFPMLCVTMHSLFGAFKQHAEQGLILEKDLFDLVLTDESGMILPSVALPAMYVAKKMVVVGDEKQIEPIQPFDKVVDKNIFDRLKFQNQYDVFFQDFSILNKNFISLVNDATYFKSFEMQDYEKNNLWLKEHFRCKDEIIEYCNEIVYKGILLPKVRQFNNSLFLDNYKDRFPSLKIFNVESLVVNNRSEIEAEAISDFLLKNIEELTKIYNEHNVDKDDIPVEDFYKNIGIVAPFNNQKNMIKQKLSKQYNLKDILIGTVHAFQGSEKEIIIFSPAIDKNCNYIHFANKDVGNMMNVAVSRAKSAFWVFGNAVGMQNSGEYTKTLENYIQHKENYYLDKDDKEVLKCPLCGSEVVDSGPVFKCSEQKYENKKIFGCRFTIFKKFKPFNREWNKNDISKLLIGEQIQENGHIAYFDKDNDSYVSVRWNAAQDNMMEELVKILEEHS